MIDILKYQLVDSLVFGPISFFSGPKRPLYRTGDSPNLKPFVRVDLVVLFLYRLFRANNGDIDDFSRGKMQLTVIILFA